MTVSSTSARQTYIGDGSTALYSYNFRIFVAAELALVKRSTTTGVETVLVNGVDFSVTGAGSYSGGTFTLTAGVLPAGFTLAAYRLLDLLQNTDLRNQGAYLAEVHERVFDRLLMIAQQLQDQLNRAVRLPDSEAGGALLKLPTKELRALQQLAFDVNGNPIAAGSASAAVSLAMQPVVAAADLAAARALAGGLIPTVATIAALKALTGTNLSSYVQVAGYLAAGDGGAGLFRWVAADATADNGGTVIAPTAGGGRFFRVYSGALNVRWFGATGDSVTNDTAAIQAAINAATTAGGGAVTIPRGTYRAIGLAINANIALAGDGRGTVIQSPAGVTTGTILALANTATLVCASVRSLELRGPGNSNVAVPTNTVVGLELGNAAIYSAQGCSFEDIICSQMHTGVKQQNSYTNVFSAVIVSQTFIGWNCSAATNDTSFVKVSAINCRTHLTATNCEGLHFHTPLWQNTSLIAGEGGIITLYQSVVTMVGPYFEQISPDYVALVGSAAEGAAAPSFLGIYGGELNNSAEAGIRVYSPYARVVVEGLRHDSTPLVIYGGDCNVAVPTAIYGLTECRYVPIGGTYTNVDGDLVAEVDGANQRVLPAIGGGGPTLTSIPHPDGYRQVSISISNRSFSIASGLTSGNWYTLAIRMRAPAGTFPYLQGLTAGAANWTISLSNLVPLNTAPFRTYYVPVKLVGDELRMTIDTTSAVDIASIQVWKGSQLRPVSVQRYGTRFNSAAPTAGTWERGSMVMNNTPTVGQPKGWLCTVAGTPGTWVSVGNL